MKNFTTGLNLKFEEMKDNKLQIKDLKFTADFEDVQVSIIVFVIYIYKDCPTVTTCFDITDRKRHLSRCDQMHVFCRSLHVKRALADRCMLIIAWDTPIWREAVSPTPSEKRKGRIQQNDIYPGNHSQTRKLLPSNDPFQNTVHLPQCSLSYTGPIFPRSFWWIILEESTEDLLHFLYHICIRLEGSWTHSVFEGWKQPEVTGGKILTVGKITAQLDENVYWDLVIFEQHSI